MTLIVRTSTDSDLTAITALYGHHVRHGTGTFELDPPTLEDMMQRRAEVLGRGLPYLVASDDDALLGFAYCNWFKPRPAYRYSAENSIYVAPEAQRRGVARALLAELLRQAETTGVRRMIAVIGDSANAGSIGVHRALGFQPAGVLPNCGWKFGRWLDVVLMDRALGLGASAAPDESSSVVSATTP